MPSRKEYGRLYRLKNKEKIKEQMRLYRLKNKEDKKEYMRLWRIKNKENIKQYRNSKHNKKSKTISQWRYRGILCFDYNLLYDIFLSTTRCEFCKVELTTGRYNTSTTKCLDHDHNINDKFNIRGILCVSCNTRDVLSILP